MNYCYECKIEMEIVNVGVELIIKGDVFHADIVGCSECGKKIYTNIAETRFITEQCKKPCFDIFEN
jgi:NADH pyrophosphatase NudC (nudix superfamily)